MANIKVTTFNIRVVAEIDKPDNDFEKRKFRIFEFVEAEKPDVIGFQEVNDHMRDCLREGLSGYTLVGCGREKSYHGESATIGYRTDKFELIELKNFWLSPTPSIPGSRYSDQSNCPRVTTAALLKANGADTPFWFINTHLDHEGKEARLFGALQLLHFIAEAKYPCVLTGDMNADPDSRPMQILVESPECRLVDCTANIKGSFHAYRDISEEEMGKIDYIFTNLPTDLAKTVLHEDKPVNGTFMSDHRPISAYVEA